MKSKLNYLIGVSLKRKIKTKWFLIVNVILALLIAGLINIDSIITMFGGDFNKKQKIYVIDNTSTAYELFENQLKSSDYNLTNSEDGSFEIIKSDKNIDELSNELKEKENDSIVIEFIPSTENFIEAKIVSYSFIDTINYQLITTSINNTKSYLAIQSSNISMEELNNIYKEVSVERIILNEEEKSEDENMEMVMTTVFPFIILPFFMLSLFLVQMIGAEVNDEKTTKSMEIIISNVSPKTHFFSKVIAGNLFVLIQGILLVVYVALGLFVRNMIGGSSISNGVGMEVSNILGSILSSGIGDKLIVIIPIVLILMILTFIAYSLVAGILASMTTNTEDFQQIQTPIIVVSLIGYYLATMAGLFKGALFIKVLSFVPFISAILSPSLLVLGQIGIIEILISILIMIVCIYLLIKYGLKIYKVGILNYSSKGLWKKMFKAMKD